MPRIASRPETPQQGRLLRLLRDSGPHSRAELGEALKLSRSKLAHEVDRLTELEFVESGGFAASRGGRRSSIVRLSKHLRFVGVDIGATSVDVAITDGQLDVLGHGNAEIGVHNGPDTVLDTALDLLSKLRADGTAPDIHGAGVGIPGPVSFRDGAPVAPPIMPGWDQYPVRETMSQALGVPVQVDNDVNLMALGELHAGVARSVDDFLLVKIGTGIGCGIVVGGELHRGVSGSAGDIGHIQIEENGPPCACGNSGCLEAYASGAALARDAMAAARAGKSPRLAELFEKSGALSAADVTDAVSVGDPAAVQLLRSGGHRVGQVLASLVSFFNPGLVVVAGGVAGAGHSLLAEMRSAVYRRSLPLATGNLPIVLSELAAAAGVVGGARLISDQVLSVPRGIEER